MPSMLEPEYEEDYNRWKADPSPANNAMILKKLHPTIEGAIRTHVGKPDPLLTSRARRMALSGLKTYDPSRGRLQTHLYNQLQGMKRVARQQGQILSVPERVSIDRYHLEQTTRQMADELGREPSDDEVMDRMGMSPRRLKTLRRYRPGVAAGALEDPETGDEFTGEVSGPTSVPEGDLWPKVVYQGFDPYHRQVMAMTLGWYGHDPLPNHEIARRLKRSPGAISQAKARIQKQLDEEHDLTAFF
jgi:AraC-like DNA-binding protein